MIGLGILAAGAAQGAANASNMNVQAQNQVEAQDLQHGRDMQRDALREEYLNKRFDKEVAINQENAKAAGALRDMEYQRNRADKIVDNDAKHKQAIEIEGFKDKRTAASNATRLQAAALRAKASGGEGGKGLQLPSGETFTPNSPEYKLAVDIVKSGLTNDLNEAINIVISKGLVSQSANSIQGLTEGTVPAARSMTGQLLGGQQPAKIDRYKLEDLIK